VKVGDLAADGVTAVVGAGGKKTTLYALCGLLDRAVLTATVRIPIFDDHVAAVRTGAPDLSPPYPLGLVAERERSDRYRGHPTAVVDEVAGISDSTAADAADAAAAAEEQTTSLSTVADTVSTLADEASELEALLEQFELEADDATGQGVTDRSVGRGTDHGDDRGSTARADENGSAAPTTGSDASGVDEFDWPDEPEESAGEPEEADDEAVPIPIE